MAPNWSPIPAKHVADGGVVRDSSFTTTSSVSSSSSPSLDQESENHTSPSSQAAASSKPGHVPRPEQPSLLILPHCTSAAGVSGVNDMAAVPISLPNGHFSCPRCPRNFSGFAKESYHVRKYRHTHHCTVAGCRWSYQLLKDLLRHTATHNTPEERDRYPCPVPGCSNTVSRQDLLKRHIERFH